MIATRWECVEGSITGSDRQRVDGGRRQHRTGNTRRVVLVRLAYGIELVFRLEEREKLLEGIVLTGAAESLSPAFLLGRTLGLCGVTLGLCVWSGLIGGRMVSGIAVR